MRPDLAPRISWLIVGICLIGLGISSIPGTASAAWVSLGGPEGAGVEVRLLESTPDRIVVDYTLGGFESEEVMIDGKAYYRISLPEEPIFLEAGLPELPHVARSVIIPDGSRMRLTVLEAQVEEFEGMAVVPSKGNLLRTVDPETVPYEFSSFYGSARHYPAEYGEAGDPYIFRDYRGMVIDARPFQAVGDGRLRVASYLRLALEAVGPDLSNAIDRAGPPASVVTEFGEIYAQHFLNYGGERYAPVGERGTMLVICYDAFMDAMAPFVEWKNQMGIPTTIVPISAVPGGNTSTAIKNYIQGLYTPEGLAFVLLVGDGAQIATPTAAGGSSDPSYSLLAGSDRYPELFVGRFSAEQVAHVQTQVARSVTYEKTPMLEGAWYQKGMGVASNQGPGDDGEYDNQHMDVIRGKLLGYGYTQVDQIYDPTGTAAQVAAALNAGRGIINYCGHGSTTSWGSTGFSNSHVAALQNDWMLPFITSVACVNGQFNGYTCFAEAWLRSTRNGNPIGAIGTYMSSINQSWNPPMCGEDEVDDLLVNDEMRTMGGLFFNGSCQMMDEYGPTDGGDMFLTWHIFGDPSLMVRTKTPQAMTAQHDGSILIGLSDYTVTIPGVANALCALYANGVLYGSAYTNGLGLATIHLNPAPAEPMTLTLTATAYNKIPILEPVEVLPPSGPFLTYAGNLVADAAGGDGDGLCDSGEAVEMSITIRNVGVETASGVTGILSEEDPFVEVQVSSQEFGDVPAGQDVTSFGAYTLSFLPETPDGHVANLTLTLDANEGDWVRAFTLPICAPMLHYAGQEIDDAPPVGNGTGWIGAGEVVNVSLVLANAGHGNATEVLAQLQPGNPLITILDGTGEASDIPAEGAAGLTPFQILVSPECPVPGVITLRASVSAAFGFSGSVEFQISVGGFADDCEVDRGWTLGAGDDTATSGLWVLADPVGTTYNGQVPQPEDDHTVSPGSICFVTGNGSVGGTAGEADVDGGKTTLLTPVFDLSRVTGATVQYWFWYTNNLGNNPSEDFWDVQITGDGANWVSIEHTTASTNDWVQRIYAVQDFVPLGERVQIRFVASDVVGAGSLVEALVDDFALIVAEPTVDAPELPVRLDFAISRISPNPTPGSAEIRYSVPSEVSLSLRVYDVSGRVVRTLVDAPVGAGEHRITWDRRNGLGHRVGSGIYFVRMQAPGFDETRTLTLIR